MSKRKEFVALDWCRFGLAVYLVFYHTWFEYPAFLAHGELFRFFGLGNMATSVFFVLSGFLLTHVYAPDPGDVRLDRRRFWTARFSTLYPLHLFGLALSLPVMLLGAMNEGGIAVPLDVNGVGDGAVRVLGTGEATFALLSQLTLTHAWNPYYLLFDVPSWSLSALLFFYLLFPFVVQPLTNLRSPLHGLILLGIIFFIPGIVAQLGGFTGIVADGVLHRNPLIRLPLFLSGIVLYSLYRRRAFFVSEAGGDKTFRLFLYILVGITILIAAHFYVTRKENLFPLIRNGLYFPAALAVVWLAATTPHTFGALHQYIAARLGKAALSIFMLHLPLFGLLTRIEKLVQAYLAGGHAQGLRAVAAAARDAVPQAGFYLVHVALIVGLSILFQERVVTPLQEALRKRLAGKAARPAPAPAVPGDDAAPRISVP